MIDAKDLRIGNKVFFTGSGHEEIVTIDGDDLAIFARTPEHSQDHYPIPLSNDLLERLLNRTEFVPEIILGTVWSWKQEFPAAKKYCMVRQWFFEKWQFSLHLVGQDSYWTFSLQYFHQLQNLYYTTIGQELPLDLLYAPA